MLGTEQYDFALRNFKIRLNINIRNFSGFKPRDLCKHGFRGPGYAAISLRWSVKQFVTDMPL